MTKLSRFLSWSYLGTIGAIALLYLASARWVIAALGVGRDAYPLWPPVGIALAALLIYGKHYWPGVFLGALLLAFSFEGLPSWQIFLVSGGATLEVWVAATLLTRGGFQINLQRLHDVFCFVAFAVVLSPMLNSSNQVFWGAFFKTTPSDRLWSDWLTIWLGDALGILVVTPVLLIQRWDLLLSASQWQHWQQQWRRWQKQFLTQSQYRWQCLEAIIWLSSLVGLSTLVFGSRTGTAIAQYPLEYLPFPFSVWAAIRFGQQGTILSSFLVSGISIAGAIRLSGPFIAKAEGNIKQAVILLQAYIGVVTVTALVLAAAIAEWACTEALLRERETSLANAQKIAQIGNWDLDLPSSPLENNEIAAIVPRDLYWSDQMYYLLGYKPKQVSPSFELYLRAVHPEDRQMVQHAWEKVFRDHRPYSLDYRLRLPDRSERLVSEQVIITHHRITGTLQDMTERKRAELALRETEQLKATMYRYMSKELAEQLIQSGDARLGGDRREVTILFSDIRSYTTLTEKMTAEDVVALLNDYFETMVEAVFQFQGTLDKYIGDAIMAVYSSPLALPDHAWKSVQTALEMRRRLVEFNASRLQKRQTPLRIGIGINSDTVITGNIGSHRRMDFTAIGDGVNLSSRLEGATKYYGCDIILSDLTYQNCNDRVWVRELDYICVKGKQQPVRIYELIDEKSVRLSPQKIQLVEQYEKGLALYRKCNFIVAASIFHEILTSLAVADPPSQLHFQRCQFWIENPPPADWDGSWNLTEK